MLGLIAILLQPVHSWAITLYETEDQCNGDTPIRTAYYSYYGENHACFMAGEFNADAQCSYLTNGGAESVPCIDQPINVTEWWFSIPDTTECSWMTTCGGEKVGDYDAHHCGTKCFKGAEEVKKANGDGSTLAFQCMNSIVWGTGGDCKFDETSD